MHHVVRWPHKATYIKGMGYVVYRDAFEVEMRCSLEEGAKAHRVATFVTGSEATDYCTYRNHMTSIYGTDDPAAIPWDAIRSQIPPFLQKGKK